MAMFVQVIQGRVSDEAAPALLRTVMRDDVIV